MRVSLESKEERCSFFAGLVLTTNAQQPKPGPKSEPLSLRHSPSGIGPAFCCALGGKVYLLAVMSRLVNLKLGAAELIELVFVIAQTPIRFSLGAKFPVSDPSPRVELRKNSVPPLSVRA